MVFSSESDYSEASLELVKKWIPDQALGEMVILDKVLGGQWDGFSSQSRIIMLFKIHQISFF